MKKIIGLFIVLLSLNGCDDGNLTIDNINFEDVVAKKCTINNIIYKIKDSEALILEIANSDNYFTNEPTNEGEPIILTINNDNKVVYRAYNAEVADGNVCATIPLSTPNVKEEWVATSGTIEITTTANIVPNTATTSGNATKISGYNHFIVFKNVTFNKPSGDQTYETFTFGSYSRPITPLSLAFNPDDIAKCSTTNQVYNISGKEALVLNLDTTFFQNAAGTKTDVVSLTNKVTYKLFESNVTSSYFCADPLPTTPILSQQWNAVDGVSGVSGIIEVVTIAVGTNFEHTIHLKKVTFKKGNNEFYLGDDYIYGTFIN